MKSSVQFNVSHIIIILWTQCWEKKYGTFWMQIVQYVTGIIFQLLKQNCIIVIISILFLDLPCVLSACLSIQFIQLVSSHLFYEHDPCALKSEKLDLFLLLVYLVFSVCSHQISCSSSGAPFHVSPVCHILDGYICGTDEDLCWLYDWYLCIRSFFFTVKYTHSWVNVLGKWIRMLSVVFLAIIEYSLVNNYMYLHSIEITTVV